MERIRRGFRLAGQSARILAADKELVLLSVVSLIAMGVVVVGLALTYLAVVPSTPATGSGEEFGALEAVFAGIGLVAVTYIGQYTLAATIGAASIRLDGGDPTLGDALGRAGRCAYRLFGWTLLTCTVGVLLRFIREQGLLGRIAAWIAEVAWGVLTFLVPAVLVHEQVGVFDSVRRSSQLFKERWGERLVGEGAIGIAMFLVSLLVIGPLVFLTVLVPPVGLVLLVVAVVVLAAVSTALSGIFRAALYRYAVTGEAPGAFSASDLGSQFRPKR